MKVLINTPTGIYFKLNEIGITDFNIYLLDRDEINVIKLENTIQEYIIYKNDYSTLTQDTVVNDNKINVYDSSYYNINDIIRIENFVAKIIDIDSQDNLYLDKLIDKIYPSGYPVKIIAYPDLLGSYFYQFQYNKVGNFNLVISNKDKNIYLVKPIEIYEETVSDNSPSCQLIV